MQKLPTFDSAKHEFTYFAVIAMKSAMAVEALENRLNIISEAINELIDRDSTVDLEAFKASFLTQLTELLDQNSEPEDFVNSPQTDATDSGDRLRLLELQYELIAQRVAKIEAALGHEKVEEGKLTNIFDLMI
ncbi:hypothetical protein [Microcoleus asticus]|uniref:Uncharacterized protein n=1 Tax=Microcoleus asticus IPMA8 TaxID=2563858 RepID=A0ABX2CXS4_9CYAN|nr:hypothetical protein [Microcoleus asticus]NQE35219.1 hypothetical protein [Microcoleus asticus IPMA8]